MLLEASNFVIITKPLCIQTKKLEKDHKNITKIIVSGNHFVIISAGMVSWLKVHVNMQESHWNCPPPPKKKKNELLRFCTEGGAKQHLKRAWYIFTYLRHVMRTILSVWTKCSHRRFSLKKSLKYQPLRWAETRVLKTDRRVSKRAFLKR